MISVAEQFSSIPESEIKRLQIHLGIILRHSTKSLKALLQNAYNELTFTENDLQATAALLAGFGILSVHRASDDELKALRSLSWAVWPDPNHCMLVEEALPALFQSRLRSRHFLLQYLKALPARERRSWSNWLKLNSSQPMEMYRQLGLLRLASSSVDGFATQVPAYLDEVFSEAHLHWFNRSVLPFYAAMRDLEKCRDLSASEQWMIALFRMGFLIIKEEKILERPSRWRVLRAEESIPAPIQIRAASYESQQQQMLF